MCIYHLCIYYVTTFLNESRMRGASLRHGQLYKNTDLYIGWPKEFPVYVEHMCIYYVTTVLNESRMRAIQGYGNIVPATSSGRIACVVFALFGAPLAIITIGDLGKFLSECTIWLYKEMKKVRTLLYGRWRRFRGLNKGEIQHEDAESQLSSSRSLDWEDLVLDKTEVPVIMVFTILLLYIAFGGVLFSFLEGWTYMDAFYYSFISLTTIGFGDIVPENHDYIVLMLAYLGIGLAVTTMCIDLVGIQYIQKIHYFGRKFRGTDLLHLLKRKRMIERRLAMGQGEEILQMYIQQMQNQLSLFSYRPPSIYSNSSASARSLMLKRLCESRGESWDESGPSISEHCSLSTEPSVHIRQAYWDDYQSPASSVLSFDYEVPLPSPDYQKIALSARRSRRLRSCPSGITVPPSQSVSNRSVPVSARHQPRCCTPTSDPLLLSAPLSFRISEPFMLSKLAVQCDSPPPPHPATIDFEPAPVVKSFAPNNDVPELELFYPQCCLHNASMHEPFAAIPRLQLTESPPSTSRLSSRFQSTLFTISEPQEETPKPLLQRKKKEREEKVNNPLHNVDWLNVSPRVMQLVKDDLPKLFEHVRSDNSSPASIVLVSPRTPVGVACMEDWDSYIRMLESYNKPYERPPQTDSSSEEENANGMDLDLGAFELVDSGMTAETLLSTEEPVIYHRDLPVHSVHHDTVQTEAALANLMSAPSSMLTAAIPPTMVEDNYCFVVDGERVRMGDILGDDQWWRHTSRPTKYFYSEDLRQFHRVNCIAVKGKVIAAKLATSALQVQTTATGVASSASTPRSSVSGASARSHGRDNKVPLAHVYKVIRFYSFWKTCTSFHRIVTMIDRVTDDRNVNPDFKKRLFVQYLWRNAKAVEKARVQKEFDPRRQPCLLCHYLLFLRDVQTSKTISVELQKQYLKQRPRLVSCWGYCLYSRH
ncbi:unnamed protein product [Haemonchus placei]|uniref:Ion_trans_2 domain-containing protein n=1 Tax=Haemonchus placei TaxID=6290 RepID=A0A158QLS8_HAEPC|nr:unnamed protein product [Haemonchus placei]